MSPIPYNAPAARRPSVGPSVIAPPPDYRQSPRVDLRYTPFPVINDKAMERANPSSELRRNKEWSPPTQVPTKPGVLTGNRFAGWPDTGSTTLPWQQQATVSTYQETASDLTCYSSVIQPGSSDNATNRYWPAKGDDYPDDILSNQDRNSHKRRPSNRDEFDGPSQLLKQPRRNDREPIEEQLLQLPTHLHPHEQDDILAKVNDRLSQCAFDFVARYQFPIPIESDKRPVYLPSDREWSEWVFLLKRLATKRRIPARVLYNGQIKQFITVLENSLEMRHAAKHQSRPLKDDRNILQLVSSGLQVAKILKDGLAMRSLDELYVQTERIIVRRRGSPAASASG